MSDDSSLLTAPYPDPVAFEAFAQNHRYLDSIWPDLLRDFEHEFVAAHEGRVVAHSPDLNELHTALDRLGVPDYGRAVRYVKGPHGDELL